MAEQHGFSLRLIGLGGQGILTLSTVIARAAESMDLEFTTLNRLRSAMRLGPVICDMRLGRPGFTPTLPPARADAVLGLEPYEGATSAGQLIRPGGVVVLNTARIPPVGSLFTGKPYPDLEPIWSALQKHGARLIQVDASAKARTITGSVEGANFYLLGVLLQVAKDFPVSAKSLEMQLAGSPAKLDCFWQGLREKLSLREP